MVCEELRPLGFDVFISEGDDDIDMSNEAFNRAKGNEVILKIRRRRVQPPWSYSAT